MLRTADGWHLRAEKIRCKKKGCNACPHGPYWYGYRKEGRRTLKKYFGKALPLEVIDDDLPPAPAPVFPEPTVWYIRLAARLAGEKMSENVAREILCIPRDWMITRLLLREAFNGRIRTWHPDRGGDVLAARLILEARDFLEREMGL